MKFKGILIKQSSCFLLYSSWILYQLSNSKTGLNSKLLVHI